MFVQEKEKSTNESDSDKPAKALQKLKETILDLSAKHREIISDWIFVWADYLKYEKTFKPDRLRIYRRGEIVHVNFGFNIGNELGGPHYAVVLDTYNSRGNGCVVVAPISSLKKGRTP